MEIYNSPHLALWKSAATDVIAKHEGNKRSKRAIDTEHFMLKAIDKYSSYFFRNEPLPVPGKDKEHLPDTDPEIAAYLSMLHHQIVHARIDNNKQLEDELTFQRGRFKFGNPLWEQQMIQYFLYYWDYPYHKGQSPKYRPWDHKEHGGGSLDFGVIKWKIPSNATIGLIGDIGTGTDFAAAVLESLLTFNPDVILHVGDIYYSGTRAEFERRFTGMINDVMKQYGKKVPVFTMPGNHEYFTGGIGFLECIDSMQLVNSEDQKQAASYFCIRTEDDQWQFLGMDTSFYGHFMDVPAKAQEAALNLLHNKKVDIPDDPSDPYWPNAFNPIFRHCTDANIAVKNTTTAPAMTPIRDDEQKWHAHKLEQFPGRTILLSHHQVYSAKQKIGVEQKQITGADGKTAPDANDSNRAWVNSELWQQFNPYLKDKVAAWFWGHEHNLEIFKDNYLPDNLPPSADPFIPIVKGRCVGHSAIPVAETEAPYAPTYPVPLVNDKVLLGLTDGWYNNGYQVLKLQGAGKPIKAAYYQVAGGDPTPLLIFEEDII